MRSALKKLVVVSATLLGLLTAGVAASPATAVASAPALVVSGNHLVDTRTSTTFTPHGVNWPSFEYACQQGWDYSGGFSTAEAAAIASWKVNIVRIPLNENCWLGTGGSPAYGTAAGYRNSVQTWVNQLHAAGVAVVIDLHWTAPAGYVADGQRAMPDAQSTTFWSSVATTFASDPSLIFDLFNEPYSRWNDATNSWAFQLTWSCWKNGGCQAPVENDETGSLSGKTYTVVGMGQLVTAVRSAGAPQPIMLGGLDYSNDLTGWLANRPSDTQLVASWHNYPGQRCDTATCWNAEVAPVAAVVPVVTGEFGETDGGSSFLTAFMTWADGHGIGYLPWAWWHVPTSESVENSRYALIADEGFAPKAPSGTAYHDHLAALPDPAPAITVQRISDTDRYTTAVAIAGRYPKGVPVVYVASGVNYPDGLSAAPAAAALGGPLLLTPPTGLPSTVRAAIVALAPARIVVAGGPASVSAAVYSALVPLAGQVERQGGADRFATSRLIDSAAFGASSGRAFFASGLNFPDALTASAAAGSGRGPVILVNGGSGSLDKPTISLLDAIGTTNGRVAGGTAVVSTGVENSVRTALGNANVKRLAGADRYSTSIAVNRDSFTTAPVAYFAVGTDFADALAGAALAARDHAPLYLVPGSCVPTGVLADLASLGTARVVLLGGPNALGPGVASLTPC